MTTELKGKAMRKVNRLLAASVLILGGLPAFAAEPTFVGSWNVTFALEPGKVLGATQCVTATLVPGLVSGMPTSGRWFSTTFPGWAGQWLELGDHVRWFGFTQGRLATHESGNMINNGFVGGVSFNHFAFPGVTSSSGNWRATRVPACQRIGALSNSADPSR